MALQAPASSTTEMLARARLREPVNGFLHMGGFVLAVLGTAYLLWRCYPDPTRMASVAVFGASMSACFLASTFHHLISSSRKVEVRLFRIDYACIYLFIAGCYTPICTHLLPGASGRILLTMVWIIAALGFVYQLALAPEPADVAEPPAPLTTGIYVAIGLLALTQVSPLIDASVGWTIALAVGGGFSYIVGGVILTRKLFDFWPGRLGHHEIWHLCVLAGAACHYSYIYLNLV